MKSQFAKIIFLLGKATANNWDTSLEEHCYIEEYPFRLGSDSADSQMFCYLRENNTGLTPTMTQTVIWQLGKDGLDLLGPDYDGLTNVLIATTFTETGGLFDHGSSYYIKTDEVPVACDISTTRANSAVVTEQGTIFTLTGSAWKASYTFPSSLYSDTSDAITSRTYSDTLWYFDASRYLYSFV